MYYLEYSMTDQRMQVGLSIGPSFAELCAIGPGKTISIRNYLPKESLKDLLKKFRSQLGESEAQTPLRFQVQLRFLEKIFPTENSITRLGGSVAQLVTAGFEDW